MVTDIKKYLALRTALANEKARIEARLQEISHVLGTGAPTAALPPVAKRARRRFSAATKAKMRAAQKARWAKIKGKTQRPAAPAKKKRKMSAKGRAAIAAAAKARWAKAKAAGKKTLAA
jgi:hypothetical protein